MKLSIDEKGFTLIEGLLIFVIVIIVGGTGYYIYHSSKQADKNLQSTSTDTKFNKKKSKTADRVTQDEVNLDYIVIKEWGVKVKVRDANKVSVQVANEPGDSPTGKVDGSANPVFKSGVLQDQSCTPGVSLYRSAGQNEFNNAKLIGSHYYFITGSPGPCMQDSDNQLKQRFLEDFTLENVQQL